MKRTFKLLATASALATAGIAATPAFAQEVNPAGTTAGTEVTNTATVNYKVGGLAQPEKENSVTFKVDRKIMFLVTNSVESGALVDTTPNKTNSVQAFTIANDTNDTIDLALELTVEGGTFGQTASDYKFYTDPGLAPEDEIEYIDEIGTAGSVTVYVVYAPAVPEDSADGAQALIRLAARPHAGGGADALGALLVESEGADDPDMVDNVFAEGEGKTAAENIAFDGVDWDDGGFEVQTATIAVTKVSKVVSDPVTGISPNAKAIPQAVIEYCISIINSSDTAAAELVISDPIPLDLTYVTGSAKVGGESCDEPGATDGTFDPTVTSTANGTVEGEIEELAGGDTQTLIFQAKIN